MAVLGSAVPGWRTCPVLLTHPAFMPTVESSQAVLRGRRAPFIFAPGGFALGSEAEVELRQYARMLAAHWRLVSAVGVLCAVAAVVLAASRPPAYESNATLIVSGNIREDVGQSYQGELLAQARLNTYAALLTEPVVLNRVVDELALEDGVPGLTNRVEVVIPENTTLIRLTVSDADRRLARATTAAITRAFIAQLAAISAEDTAQPALEVVTVQPATLPQTPLPRHLVFQGLLGLLAGLAIGVAAAVPHEYLRGRVHDGADAEWLGQAPVRGVAAPVPGAGRMWKRSAAGDRRGAYRDLATSVSLLSHDRPGPVVVVTPTHDRGTSSLVAHVADALAHSAERVLLITRGRIKGGAGAVVPSFMEVLAGQAPVDHAIQKVQGRPSLLLMQAYPDTGPVPSIDVVRLRDVMATLVTVADLVLVDAPALDESLDGPLLASAGGTTLMVLRPGHSRRRDVARAVHTLQVLSGAPDGLILDRTDARRRAGSGPLWDVLSTSGERR